MSIYGWRWWNLAPNQSLQSVNNVLWPPGEPMKAECGRKPPTVDPIHNIDMPHLDCTCGFWAFYDTELAEGLPHADAYFRHCKVYGVVEAWGNICYHEWGFRAEYMAPRAVVVQRGRLHKTYEIERYSSIAAMLEVWDVIEKPEDYEP